METGRKEQGFLVVLVEDISCHPLLTGPSSSVLLQEEGLETGVHAYICVHTSIMYAWGLAQAVIQSWCLTKRKKLIKLPSRP